MSDSSNILNKCYEKGRDSSNSIEKYLNDTLQLFVNDIPFQFNEKYQTTVLSDIDIPDYDINQIHNILSKSIDFTLENKVLIDALEDLKRKKKQIQSDISKNSSSILSSTDTSISVNNISPLSSFRYSSVRDIYWPSHHQN